MFKTLRINHIAIATKTLNAQIEFFDKILKLPVSERLAQPEHGVYTTFVDTGNTKIELLEVLGDSSPISGFVNKNSEKIHHICFEVDNLEAACDHLRKCGVRILGNIKIGAHAKPVVFLHPKDTNGTLIEIEQQ